jgi:hypothetical protein
MRLQPFAAGKPIPTHRFIYGLRLVGALLIATLVPILIDLRARRSSRTRQ